MGQTIATNILFEEAHTVFKGRVESISNAYQDDEQIEYSIQVRAEEYYKGGHYDKGAIFRIITHRPRIIDTVKKEIIDEQTFLVKTGEEYIFFIQKPQPVSGEESLLFAQLAVRTVEAIPFSTALEKCLAGFDKVSWIEAHDHSMIAMKLMFQGSDTVTIATVGAIVKNNSWGYDVNLLTPAGDSITLHLHDLHCVSADGIVTLNKSYIFFLNKIAEDKYLLTDRWLGILDVNSLTKQYTSSSK